MIIRTTLLASLLAGLPLTWFVARADEPTPITLAAPPPPAAASTQDTLWVIPHTHWEGAVFKTREEYLEMGLPHILHALQLLEKYPTYTFVLDQVGYVRPFLERFPEHEAAFRKFIAQGRLQLVLGMDVMPDVNKPGAESFVRQIQYGKGYYRQKLGVDVTTAWLLDTFGHHAQMPQILKLGGYKSFWFFRGVPNREHPSEFLWEGIDGTQIPAVWLPHAYGLFYGAPATLPEFEKFARSRFDALTLNARGHDRLAPAGVDVSDPEDQLPAVMKLQQESGHELGFKLRFGVPSEFDAAVARQANRPVFKGELNPTFQGTYSSRIELKQAMRTMERMLTTAEKLGAISQWLGAPPDNNALWRAWEPVLFSETHDLASGVMTDHVYQETLRELDFSRRSGDWLIEQSWQRIIAAADTQGAGIPIIAFNTLGWPRSDIAQVILGFTEPGINSIDITDRSGAVLPVQIVSVQRGRDGGIRQARVAFLARNVPPLGYCVYHALAQSGEADPKKPGPPELLDDRGTANAAPNPPATQPQKPAELENEFYRLTFDRDTGAIVKLHVKDGDWEAISGPANIVSREEDKGDLWELYHGLDGGSRFAMTQKQPVPQPGNTTKISNEFKGEPGVIRPGPVFSEFSVAHPFDNGKFATIVRLAAGSRRIDITTRLVNASKLVRYQALFPTTIHNGRSFQAIPFGASERPQGIEFPAQDWVDFGDGDKGIALLNVGLPGNLVTDGTLMLSLLRSHTLAAYGFGGGFEPGMTSDTGYELGVDRSMHYALMPHPGDWRDAQVYRHGMEFGNPLLCRTAAPHSGTLPPRWGWLSVSLPNVVVSSLQSGRDGAALLRVYEAAGKPASDVKLTLTANILSAGEVNLMEDPIAPLKPQGKTLTFDLSPFQIKTFSLRLAAAVNPDH